MANSISIEAIEMNGKSSAANKQRQAVSGSEFRHLGGFVQFVGECRPSANQTGKMFQDVLDRLDVFRIAVDSQSQTSQNRTSFRKLNGAFGPPKRKLLNTETYLWKSNVRQVGLTNEDFFDVLEGRTRRRAPSRPISYNG